MKNILLSATCMTKATTPTENPKKQIDNTKMSYKIFKTIADRLRMVGWCNDSHQTGVVKQVTGI